LYDLSFALYILSSCLCPISVIQTDFPESGTWEAMISLRARDRSEISLWVSFKVKHTW